MAIRQLTSLRSAFGRQLINATWTGHPINGLTLIFEGNVSLTLCPERNLCPVVHMFELLSLSDEELEYALKGVDLEKREDGVERS